MAFQDELRTYLERLALRGADAPRSWFDPDVRLHRQHLLRELERLEKAGKPKRYLERLHLLWSDRVASFALKLGTELVNGLCHRQPGDVPNLINIAISRELKLDASTGSFIKDAELDRLVREVYGADFETDISAEQYAIEIRAVRRSGERRLLTPLGRIALELPDRDIVRWLLTAETTQSRGFGDPWRMSRAEAEALHAHPSGLDSDDPEETHLSFPASIKTMQRLSKMGILSLYDATDDETGQPFGRHYEVYPEALSLLAEIATRQDTPFAVLISALLSDETEATLAPNRPISAHVSSESAAMATTRHARMVTHEIRNALVPVQSALERLYTDAERRGQESLLDKHREPIDQGIERIFRFVKDMMDVAERGVEPPESFQVTTIIGEAIEVVASDFGVRAQFEAMSNLPPVKGYRHRFTLVMVNLLRNAAQAANETLAQIVVRVQGGSNTPTITITVDDNGPGVPIEHQTNIFKQGFSLRPGGTGQGLALVREVIEAEMGGQAICTNGPLGGARFVLQLPVGESNSK